MKRTPLKRKTPMKRQWIKRSSKKNSYAKRPRFTDHMVWVKTLPCVALDLDGHACSGPVEADHAGVRAMGRKCHDFETIPLCKAAHDARPGRRYPFDLMTRSAFREWLDTKINEVIDLGLIESPQKNEIRAWLRESRPELSVELLQLVYRNFHEQPTAHESADQDDAQPSCEEQAEAQGESTDQTLRQGEVRA